MVDPQPNSEESDDAKYFDKEAILRKIASLQALVDHPSTEDSLRFAALAKIKRLTDKYSISLDDFEKAKAYTITEDWIEFSNPITKSRLYIILIMTSVADFLNVKLMTLTYHGMEAEAHGVRVIGTDMDVKSSLVGISYIMNEVKRQLQTFYDDVALKFEIFDRLYLERYRSYDYFGVEDFDRPRRVALVQQEIDKIPAPRAGMYFRAPRPARTVADVMEAEKPQAVMPFWKGQEYEAMIAKVAGRFFIEHKQMVDIESKEWLHVEASWGIGLKTRFAERLKEELENTDDEDELTPKQKWGFSTVQNPMVKSSRELAIISDTVRQEKMDRINDHLRDEKIEKVQVIMEGDNPEIAQVGGHRAANSIDLSALRKKSQ